MGMCQLTVHFFVLHRCGASLLPLENSLALGSYVLGADENIVCLTKWFRSIIHTHTRIVPVC
jgi:hypothetical protein